MYREVASAVYKRAVAQAQEGGDAPAIKVPGWAFGLILLDWVIVVPVLVYVGYTLNNLFPVLAMIEDPAPPAYDPVSLNDDGQSVVDDAAPHADEAAHAVQTRQITASLRDTDRAIRAVAGWRSYFRGLACYVAPTVSVLFVYGIVGTVSFVPRIAAALISALALVHLYTAWLHIVISAPSPKRFWQRLPNYNTAFKATALPTCIYFAVIEIQTALPRFLARLMHMTTWDPSKPNEIPTPRDGDSWKGLIVMITSILITVFLTIPAHVVLTRCQASLLPEEDETIVPFDRSFQGKLEPAIVGGRGYVTVKDAWETFSRASWIRLVKLYVKVFAVGMGLYLAFALILVPQIYFIMSRSQ